MKVISNSHFMLDLALLIYIILIPCSGISVSKSVHLTPLNHTLNGASVNIIHSDVSVSSESWNITVTNQQGYHLKVSLDNTWGFHSNYISTIQFIVYGTRISSDLDTVFSFSVNNNQYVTLIINLDEDQTYNNDIYPYCSGSSAVPLASGNINNLVNTTHSSRESSSTNNGQAAGNHMQLPNYDNNKDNEMPLIFSLRNDPNNNILLLSYTNTLWNNWKQQCLFTSFNTNNGADFYVAIDDNNEKISITAFNIHYAYNFTANPTQNPTTDTPTTSNPTTKLPTTQNPTTGTPTTHSPVTGMPVTQSPTSETPTTQNPSTDFPTTLLPTITPSLMLNTTMLESIATDIKPTDSLQDSMNDSGEDNFVYYIIGVIGCLCVLVVCIIIICTYKAIRNNKNPNTESENDNKKHLPIATEMKQVKSISTDHNLTQCINSSNHYDPHMHSGENSNSNINSKQDDNYSSNILMSDISSVPKINQNKVFNSKTVGDNNSSSEDDSMYSPVKSTNNGAIPTNVGNNDDAVLMQDDVNKNEGKHVHIHNKDDGLQRMHSEGPNKRLKKNTINDDYDKYHNVNIQSDDFIVNDDFDVDI